MRKLGRDAVERLLNRKASLAAVALAVLLTTHVSSAQTYNVLHEFSGSDGMEPYAGVTLDAAGALYGTTAFGGASNPDCITTYGNGCGTIYKMVHRSSGWVFSQLYQFGGANDSAYPMAALAFGPDGALYGTTQGGAPNTTTCSQNGCGTVFRLQPQPSVCNTTRCSWKKTILYTFTGGVDGSLPGTGNLVFDSAGNIYGTTQAGGAYGAGTVFKLTRSGQGYVQSVLYSFSGHIDGGTPVGGVVFDSLGNIYGTTEFGGTRSFGTLFKLIPSGSGWSERILHSFTNTDFYDGAYPMAAPTLDGAGNVYGTTAYGPGSDNLGTVFVYTVGGEYTFMTEFPYLGGVQAPGPVAALTLSPSGNLYGTQYCSQVTAGSIFSISPQPPFFFVNELVWLNGDDGNNPAGGVALDASGNAYGTTISGGQYMGVVWEITPQ
jgi:uncharacterized repeat protein (TIGR03803 family)